MSDQSLSLAIKSITGNIYRLDDEVEDLKKQKHACPEDLHKLLEDYKQSTKSFMDDIIKTMLGLRDEIILIKKKEDSLHKRISILENHMLMDKLEPVLEKLSKT
jgi:predicted  nucleic acid-binding Zn-ribbon protein